MSKDARAQAWMRGTDWVAVGDEAVERLAGPRECGEGADGGEGRRIHLCDEVIRGCDMAARREEKQCCWAWEAKQNRKVRGGSNLESVLVEIVDSKSAHAVNPFQEHNPR